MPNPSSDSIFNNPCGTLAWLEEIMQRLLGPNGCPWDREQTLQTLKPFLLEEAYEVLDAIDSEDADNHTEELGDLLFQIVFQGALAKIPTAAVIQSIGDKLIRRHPHIFGDAQVSNSDEVIANWETIKAQERADKPRGVFDAIPRSMPALSRARATSRRAAKRGFDWPDETAARRKVSEEFSEVIDALSTGTPDDVFSELGDFLFAISSWSRKLNVDPEEALHAATKRFQQRFGHMEAMLAAREQPLSELSLDEWMAAWQQVKLAR